MMVLEEEKEAGEVLMGSLEGEVEGKLEVEIALGVRSVSVPLEFPSDMLAS